MVVKLIFCHKDKQKAQDKLELFVFSILINLGC